MVASPLLALVLATAPATTTTDEADVSRDASSETQTLRRSRRNAASIVASFPVPDYQLGVAYQRALGRHFSVSGQLDYTIPRPGFGHLIGMSETVGVQGWVRQPLHGLYGELTMSVAHSTLRAVPELSHVTLTPALGAGYTWQLRVGMLLGVGGALRFARRVAGSELVCTRPAMCPATRSGIHASIALRVGWAW